MVSKQQTKKPQTKLMQLVCKRAALMRECYRGSSCDTDKKVQTNKNVSICSINKTKQTSQFNNKVKRNVPHASFSIEKVCMNEGYISLHV
jgi:hypothetical protein